MLKKIGSIKNYKVMKEVICFRPKSELLVLRVKLNAVFLLYGFYTKRLHHCFLVLLYDACCNNIIKMRLHDSHYTSLSVGAQINFPIS